MNKKPFYLTVVKTKDDRLYCPINACCELTEADHYAANEITKIRKSGLSISKKNAVELHIVIEKWESEKDFDRSSGSVETIKDTRIFATPSFAKRYDI